MDRFSIRIERQPGRVVVRLLGRSHMDYEQVQDVNQQLHDAVKLVKRGVRLVLDLRSVRFMSSAMLGVFVLLNKECLKRDSRMEFWHLRPAVLEVFRICRLDRLFRIGDETAQYVAEPVGFCPDLFECRNQVIACLESAGYSWVAEFSTISPIHDLYGIEVDGIRSRQEAVHVSRLLRGLFPDWGHRSVWLGWRWGAEPTWKSCIWRDGYLNSGDFDDDESD